MQKNQQVKNKYTPFVNLKNLDFELVTQFPVLTNYRYSLHYKFRVECLYYWFERT